MAGRGDGPRYEVIQGSVTFKTPLGARRKVATGQTSAEIPAESVAWLIGAGIIRPAGKSPQAAPPLPDDGITATGRFARREVV